MRSRRVVRGRGDDPSELGAGMWRALLFLAGEKLPPKARQNPLRTGAVNALERRRLIEWERSEQRTGWRLTDKGRFAVAWWRARRAAEGTDA